MNLTMLETARRSKWARIGWQPVSFAVGMTLVTGAALLLGGTSSSKAPAIPGPRSVSAAIFPNYTPGRPRAVFYLVADEARADKVKADKELAEWVRDGTDVIEPGSRSYTLVIDRAGHDDLDQEQTLVQTASELMLGGVNVQVVDLREE